MAGSEKPFTIVLVDAEEWWEVDLLDRRRPGNTSPKVCFHLTDELKAAVELSARNSGMKCVGLVAAHGV